MDIRNITLGKGKLFGPDDYVSFSAITIFILIFIFARKHAYDTNSFENLELVNIYNALKPAEVNQIFEDNKISPLEAKLMETEGNIRTFNINLDYKKYKTKQIFDNISTKTNKNIGFGVINDIPKVDIKQKFKSSIKNNNQ